MTLSLRALALGTAAASAFLAAGTASAQPGLGMDIPNPPELKKRGASPDHPFDPDSKEIRLDLNIEYVDGVIYNPRTGVDDKVRLRGYTQDGLPLPQRYVSPSINARPGDTVRISLNNKLPATTTSYDAGCASAEHNVPHCFNGSNLHFHGLNVNPSGNGDNVLLSINPGVKFEYEIAIAPEHPAGTFWYHTHRHGSTALQVSSGMAGPLIVKGDRVPTPTRNGDLDTLLGGVSTMKERTLVFQQIQYGCFDQNQDIKFILNNQGNAVRAWTCDANDVGGVETYQDKNGLGFGTFSSWGQSGRYTSINGYVIPTFQMKQNAVERWRMIHGGIRDTIRVIFVKANGPSVDPRPGEQLAAENMEAFVQANCSFQTQFFDLVAADGLTMKQAMHTRNATMQPGYRWDALVSFPVEGEYCMLDVTSQSTESVGGLPSGVRLLGIVKVARDQDNVQRGTVTQQLVDAAQKTMPADVRDAVIADLNNGMRFSRFTPHQTIAQSELSGGQQLTFDIQAQPTQTLFMVANQLVGSAGYNPQPYNPARTDRKLTLGTAEEWKLTSNGVGHPFHIHVNPFEIVSIVNNNNPSVDVSVPGSFDNGDPQYVGLKGLWKDTLWIKPNYTVTIRSRYERYIGDFVLHCHILDHEDQGMMQNVAIVLPGGTSASVNAAPADPHGIH
ncbi:MAG TPA: multicopper oxidase domain-containing protein [Allosphingosinicella sp.]|nr:multicopper oxidase domain-containing protein [Allosphingosinicella sp.]